MNSNPEGHARRTFEKPGSTRLSRRDLLALFGSGMAASLHTACSPSSTPSVEDPVDRGPLHYLSLTEVALHNGTADIPVFDTPISLRLACSAPPEGLRLPSLRAQHEVRPRM
jgi:hypothetical protein